MDKKNHISEILSQFKISKNAIVTGYDKLQEWKEILMKIDNGTMKIDNYGNIKLPKDVTSSIVLLEKDIQQVAIDFFSKHK